VSKKPVSCRSRLAKSARRRRTLRRVMQTCGWGWGWGDEKARGLGKLAAAAACRRPGARSLALGCSSPAGQPAGGQPARWQRLTLKRPPRAPVKRPPSAATPSNFRVVALNFPRLGSMLAKSTMTGGGSGGGALGARRAACWLLCSQLPRPSDHVCYLPCALAVGWIHPTPFLNPLPRCQAALYSRPV
jgi:pimeloyl-ACP methyl ester carboxylesterase